MKSTPARMTEEPNISPLSSELLEQIRSRFHHVDHCPYTGKRIFLENAGGTLTLKKVCERLSEIGAIPDNEGRRNAASEAMSVIVNQGLEDLRTFFGARSGVVFGGETGTECIFRLMRSAAMAAPEGGSILSSSVEHPGTYSATQVWADRTSREWIEVPFDTQTGVVSADDYARCVRPDTRVATIIHTNPVTGIVMDVKGIVKAIRAVAPECYIIVDGVQHAPHGYLDVETYGADGYVLSLYKVYSKFNNGYAWVSDRMSRIPHDRILGKPDESWELGSRDPSAMAAASEVVNYIAWLGGHFTTSTNVREQLHAAGEVILQHEHVLISMLLDGTDKHSGLTQMAGVKVVGTQDINLREGVVSFSVDGREAVDIVAALEARGIRTHTRSSDIYSGNILRPLGLDSVVRVSLAHYNTAEEVGIFLDTMEELLKV